MAKTLVKRAFKYRFTPTVQQERELLRTFGCVRHVYNMALEARTAAWYRERRRVTYAETSALLTEWKTTDELAFLNEVSSVPLQQCLRHLQKAFTSFWEKRARYPRYKSRKRGKATAEYTRSAFRYRDGQLTLAKMAEPLAIVWSRPLPPGARPATVTVSRDPAGRWFVALLVETSVGHLPAGEAEVGVDAGLTAFVTLSTGEKVTSPRENEDRARLAVARRSLARKQKGSRNQAKARRRVARILARIGDRRRDFLHKLSTRLVRENQTIVIEDLNVRELRSMLEYKTQWYGRRLVVVDRWYPSTRTCSECGLLLDRLPAHVRGWTCRRCGAKHDRDVNAAKAILAAGRAVTACGAGVRPPRH
ncbi:RNA-guided endonuclease InsQ/TnpB family protein [Actinocrispum wychmicini]|uniref:Putative transposase n=1 Tax=Actinocrispum wychmicini TaxID=1213861 RepID=A0A4V2S717_9PSEU|nr:RNA-guided endonuclease TnpB family protein [Actinocrispum wychmicini]TCO58190.1 putative transposase [Actinocrispum wychmicini]